MSIAETSLILSSGLMAGVLASAHCVLMCGGISVLVAQQGYGLWPHLLRITTYVLFAVLAGSFFSSFMEFPRWILGVALVAAGLISWWSHAKSKRVANSSPLKNARKNDQSVFFKSSDTTKETHACHSNCSHQKKATSPKMLWLWGFLPCPMVFMMISTSATLKPFEAGLMMAGFVLGTLPALISVSYGAKWFLKRLSSTRPWFQMGLVAAGAWVIILEGMPMHMMHAMTGMNHDHMQMESMDHSQHMNMDHSKHMNMKMDHSQHQMHH